MIPYSENVGKLLIEIKKEQVMLKNSELKKKIGISHQRISELRENTIPKYARSSTVFNDDALGVRLNVKFHTKWRDRQSILNMNTIIKTLNKSRFVTKIKRSPTGLDIWFKFKDENQMDDYIYKTDILEDLEVVSWEKENLRDLIKDDDTDFYTSHIKENMGRRR